MVRHPQALNSVFIDTYFLIVNNDIVRKVIVFISVIVGVVLLCFWLLFYSTPFANNPKVISLRNTYFDSLDRGSLKNLFLYNIHPIKINENQSFTYSFPGKFQDWDFVNSTIILKDLYGRVWKFRYTPNATYDGYDKLMYDEMVVAKDKSSISTTQYLIINTKNLKENKRPFAQGEVLFIFWSDERKLGDIMKARKDGIIEMKGAGMIPIIQVIWE